MRCPLCSGPVREADGRLACEVGHEVAEDDLRESTDARLAEALWMAIEALDSEAQVLGLLGRGSDNRFADDAASQAAMLPDFARRHAGHIDA